MNIVIGREKNDQGIAFLRAIFAPDDIILLRNIETWTEDGNTKRSKIKGTWNVKATEINQERWAGDASHAAMTFSNQFFGVCPRAGAGGYDLACQVRTVRCLWSDIDDCNPTTALDRCRTGGVPEPSIVVSSGHGAHLYWLFAEPCVIEDAYLDPVKTEWVQAGERCRPVRLDKHGNKVDPTSLLGKQARWIQELQHNIAAAIGGDSTHDLARLLRLPSTFNRKNEAKGPVKVAFWTGESGAPTIRETALRIAKSKQIDLKDALVSWSFDLPKLCRIDHLTALEGLIREQQLEVVFIDPLYLSLLSAETAGSAGNLYAMGAALEPLNILGQATGATISLLHHFKKSGIPDPDNPAALEELSQSGAAEWARQWILLQRRTPYNSDGRHDLWLRAGGSAGHSSLVAVTVEEGLIDPDTGSGRHWKVVVSNRAKAIADDKEKLVAEKQDQRDRAEADRIQKVVAALESHPNGETASGLRNDTGIDSPKLKSILTKMVTNGQVVGTEVGKNGAKYDGFKLVHGTVV